MANTTRKRKQRGVYQVRNLSTGKLYVGSSEDLIERWRIHKYHLRHGDHPSRAMMADLEAFGLDSFIFEVLEDGGDHPDLFDREQFWLDKLQPFIPNGYNLHIDARSGKGVRLSEEVRRNISNGHKGLRFTQPHRKAISDALKGQERSAEHAAAISQGRKASARAKSAILVTNAAKRLLSDEEVRCIRSMTGGATAIAREFGVSRRVIRAILSGETYAEIK